MAFRKILVGVDGSDAAEHALNKALELAAALDAHLTVLEVIEEFGPLPGMYGKPPPGRDRVQWLSEQRFEGVRTQLQQTSVPWDRRVEEGYPADVLCRVAEEGNFDLLVVGQRGMTGVGRFLIGSVSDRVVHHAPCSVVVVRPDDEPS